MKISVIIPAHNEEKYISNALAALNKQDYPDFEIIVVDNGSTDKTKLVASTYLVRIVDEKNKGTMWACERGRKEASGDIIVRMDADCVPDPLWLRRGSSHFLDSSVSIVSGPYDYYDSAPAIRKFLLFAQQVVYTPVNFILGIFHAGGITLGGNTFIRATSLQKVGGFNTDITFYGDDTDTAKRLSTQGRVVFDPHLVIPSSARRFKSQGTVNLLSIYFWHFFKQIFLRK